MDHIYNISALKYDYVNPTVNGNLSCRSTSSCTSDSGEALENWKNRLHEVSMRRCAKVTRSMRRVENRSRQLTSYEGLPKLVTFLIEFEGLVTDPQWLSALDYVLKATPARWWGAHKKSIYEWP